MITAIALMCALESPGVCLPIVKQNFYSSEEDCKADIMSAASYAISQGGYLRDYKCIVWSETT